MRRILIFILIGYCSYNCHSQSRMTTDSIVADFKIEKIQSIRDDYIIYASHADTLYKIISQKVFKISAEKIKKGNVYRLCIISFFKGNIYPTQVNSINVSPGSSIKRQYDTKQLYYTLDLTGLYLIPLTKLYYNVYYLPVDYPSETGYFKIMKIEKKKGVYLIHAEKDSIIYWIISPGKPKTLELEKLKTDTNYYLQLYSYFETANNFTRIIEGSVEVRPRKLIKPHPISGQLYFTFDIFQQRRYYE